MPNNSAITPQARTRAQKTWFTFANLIVILVVWSIMAALISPVLFYAMPDLEARFYPVLTNQKIDNVHLSEDGEFQLWEWSFYKNRRGYVDFAAFMAYLNPQEKYTTDVFVGWDCKDSFRTSRSVPVGDTIRNRKMCARLPAPLQGKGVVTIRGYAEYRVGHTLYTVPALIPPIGIGDPELAPAEALTGPPR